MKLLPRGSAEIKFYYGHQKITKDAAKAKKSIKRFQSSKKK